MFADVADKPAKGRAFAPFELAGAFAQDSSGTAKMTMRKK